MDVAVLVSPLRVVAGPVRSAVRCWRASGGGGAGKMAAEAVAAGTGAVVAGDVATIAAGRIAGRWWATVLCCGFDSAVTDRANRLR